MNNDRYKNWLLKAKNKFGNKFDYSQVEYQNSHKKIKIICPLHGIFIQSPIVHLQTKTGCSKCGATLTVETVIRKYGKDHYHKTGIQLNQNLTREIRNSNQEKTRITQIKNKRWIPENLISPWEKYKRSVRKISNSQPLDTLLNHDKRGFNKGKYNLDHIYSIYDGFINNVDPAIIGNIKNLRYITFEENRLKSHRSDVTIEKLMELISDTTK
jgi:hypothetical protein